MKIDLVCQNCSTGFTVNYKFRNKKFCCQDCYLEFAKKNKLFGKKKDPTVREIRVCLECGVEFTERKKHDRKLCSNECRTKWGNDPVRKNERTQKTKDALLKIYGVDSLYKLDSFQKKCKEQVLKKYGVYNHMEVPEIKRKLQNTLREKHLKKLLPTLEINNLKLLGEYTVNKSGNTSLPYNFQCLKCDNIFSSTLLGSGKIPVCRKCFPIVKNSKLEGFIKDFLNEKQITHIDNNRKILDGCEIDVYIPEHNLGIEINGNYFHSEIHGEKDKFYHIKKSQKTKNKGIKLIQIFEDELLLKKEITLSRISSMLNLNEKVYARNCTIKEVTKKISNTFLNDNHIQGESVDKYRYGLYVGDKLVSLMTFGSKRKVLGYKEKTTNEFELVRFCNVKNLNVIGGFSKLLKYFVETHNPEKIITYADIRWSGINPEDTVYHKNGFNFIDITPPNYWYVDTKQFLVRHHRYNFRKNVLVEQGYNPELTEWDIMKEKKFDRIWDCGSMKFELIINKKTPS